MISRMMKELQKRKKDNKGAALVLVIVAIAFVGMLVAMILYMAYCNYLMKSNDRMAKDNFYSAEYALDVINAGLQMDISECMAEAYVKTMNNSLGKDSQTMEADFREEFVKKVVDKIQDRPGGTADPSKWNLDHLKNFWMMNDLTLASVAGNFGAYLEAEGDNNKLEIATSKSYVTLYNLKVVYTDEKGFVSIITTDIRLRVPEIGFAQSASKMNIENFSLIANNSLVNDNNAQIPAPGETEVSHGADVAITGNVFGGYEGVQVANQKRIYFKTDPNDKAPGMDEPSYNLIADSLNTSNTADAGGILVDDTFITYVDDINVHAGRLELDGTVFVGDDLDVSGKRSDVTLLGKYNGYGNNLNGADGSSSILINGGDTTLDFSGLDELLLSGHAYVGAKKYDADADRLAYATSSTAANMTSDKIENKEEYDEAFQDPESTYKSTETTIPTNDVDMMMGESISVKANQLLYMVPAECIGYRVSTGEQVIAKNPMTYEEYKMLTDTEEPMLDDAGNKIVENNEEVMKKVYDPVRLDKLWTKLGGIAYTNDYKAVYRRVNGSVLVYLYLDFGVSEVMANEFFKAYYEYDKEGIDNYVNSYITNMTWNSNLNTKLTLAGNAFYFSRNDEVVFVEDDLGDAAKYKDMMNWQTKYSQAHYAMMHSLSPEYEAMSGSQSSSQIFNSLVDEDEFTRMSGKDFKNESGDILARIVDGSVVYPSTTVPEKTKMIVSSGDIFITKDFKGLAIAGGNIYLCSGCSNVNYSPAEVLQAMRTKTTDSTGKTMYAYEIFGASGALSYATEGDEEATDEAITLSDLILYQNWQKE